MTGVPCGCDDSKAWKARCLESEAQSTRLEHDLRSARVSLERILERIDVVLNGMPGEDVVGTDGDVIGQTVAAGVVIESAVREPDEQMSQAVWQRVGNWMAERLSAPPKGSR